MVLSQEIDQNHFVNSCETMRIIVEDRCNLLNNEQ